MGDLTPDEHAAEAEKLLKLAGRANLNDSAIQALATQALAHATLAQIETRVRIQGEPVSPHIGRRWVTNHPQEALTALVEARLLTVRHLVPESPYVAPEGTWRLIDDEPGLPSDKTTVYVPEGALPPLIGGEGQDLRGEWPGRGDRG